MRSLSSYDMSVTGEGEGTGGLGTGSLQTAGIWIGSHGGTLPSVTARPTLLIPNADHRTARD